ncbi:MAG: GTP-binding protein [Candidatus Heimdallarchaeota archaeon]|nr:MAG: GTP-binding protein [Candidatus Heimdallarchaeota archaeon]
MSQIDYDFLAKILLLGEYRVGKSSMVLRYVENRFPGDYMATIGANFLVKTVNIPFEGKSFKVGLQIWDIGGHARSSQVGRVFFQGVSGALLVYDLTRKKTLEKLPLWVEQLKRYSTESRMYLVGNKNDLVDERQISKEEGEDAKKQLDMINFFETSAKTGDHIQETFEDLAQLLVTDNRDKILDVTRGSEK